MPVLCLSFAIVLLDQLTKHLVQDRLDRYHGVVIIPGFFDFRYVQNTGAAWGMLQGLNSWLVALSVVMLGLLIVFRRHILPDSLLARLAGGLIIGGIIGNLIDRVRWSYVVDFLHLHWRGHAFPTFNIADAAICIGVGLFIVEQWRQEHRQRPAATPAPGAADARP